MGFSPPVRFHGNRSEAILVIVAAAALAAYDFGMLRAALRQARATWYGVREPVARAR
jgi:hypothetical protein